MISRPLVAGLLFLTLAGVARAGETEAVKSTVAKVQGRYARLAPGLFVQTNVIPAHVRQTAEIWVDVRFAGEVAGARDRVVAQSPGGQRIEIGDLVEVRIVPDDGRASALPARRVAALPEKSQVTGVRAKYDTAEAMDFGASPVLAITLSAR